MPQGMGYPKGDMVMKKKSMSEMMGMKKSSTKDDKSCSTSMKKQKMFPFKKGGK
jgi:hypothetical protein